MSFRPRLLIVGEPGFGQSSHLAPAVIHALEKFTVYTLDIPVLFGISTTSPEETCSQVSFPANNLLNRAVILRQNLGLLFLNLNFEKKKSDLKFTK